MLAKPSTYACLQILLCTHACKFPQSTYVCKSLKACMLANPPKYACLQIPLSTHACKFLKIRMLANLSESACLQILPSTHACKLPKVRMLANPSKYACLQVPLSTHACRAGGPGSAPPRSKLALALSLLGVQCLTGSVVQISGFLCQSIRGRETPPSCIIKKSLGLGGPRRRK